MIKFLIFFSVFTSSFYVAQSKYTEAQVEKSNDVQVIANFVKYNPTHPRTPGFKRKLISAMNSKKTPAKKEVAAKAVAKATAKPVAKSTKAASTGKTGVKKEVAENAPVDSNKKTVDLLNHMFNSGPSSKIAYLQIVNKSKCNLTVKILGEKHYNLDVPANDQNFVLVSKGNYNITTSVCGASYASAKKVTKDIVLTLNTTGTIQ